MSGLVRTGVCLQVVEELRRVVREVEEEGWVYGE